MPKLLVTQIKTYEFRPEEIPVDLNKYPESIREICAASKPATEEYQVQVLEDSDGN